MRIGNVGHGAGWILLPCDDARFPSRVKQLPDCPSVLAVRGDPLHLSKGGVAIVGSRRPSGYGVHMAREIAGPFARLGYPIISGLARGIDATAHLSALEAGGPTIAVMGTGPDQVYPKEHGKLAERIAAQGALVTEFPPGTPPLKHHFPQRNRIIAAMATVVVVVEAGIPSGSVITAHHAVELGRTVLAVPGRTTDPKSRGTLNLIFDGAIPVRTPIDVLEALHPDDLCALMKQITPPPPDPDLDPLESRLLLLFRDHDEMTLDTILVKAGAPAPQVLTCLFSLEVGGLIESLPGSRYRRS